MKSKVLIDKVKRTLRDEGFFSVMQKGRRYVSFKRATKKRQDEMKDLLFINGCGLKHPERYRVDYQMEQLEACGLSVEKVFYTLVKPEMLKYYRAVIIFRCPITNEIKELIERAHYFNKRVFYDIDDLVIDKKYTDEIDYVRQMNNEDRVEYDDGVVRMGETMKMCDYCITTTSALARELKKYGKEVYINKNVVSEKMVKISLDAMKEVKKNGNKIRIGYLSGSITHNPDFEMIKSALIKIMDEYPQVELTMMGPLDLPNELRRFGNRIIRKPFTDWAELPKIIAKLDINLAPIEKTIFNEAKSENKWTEASLCKVVTVASGFGAFREAINDGKDGLLCSNGEDWYKKIKKLIEDEDFRKTIAQNAHKRVLKEYVTTYTGRGLAEFIKSKLARNIAFVLPSTHISGGVNVVLKHCDILRRNGWDVMVINMDTSDDDVINEDGRISVVSGATHNVLAKFDVMVATLFTTLKYIKQYPDVRRKLYLVQNYETDFNDYGALIRQEAQATYNAEGIKFITISKWCKDWLEKDFGQKAIYAPNGIDLEKFEYKERKTSKRIKILIEGNSDDYYKNVDESFRVVEKLDSKRFEINYLSYQGEPKKWYRVDNFYHKISHDEVGAIYRKCDILLKTSILESFSYPPLEMMATGGYVVAVANAGNREFLKNEENCLFYEQGNIDEAVQKIERIADDVEIRKILSKNGRKTAEERDWNKIEDKVLRLYQ